MDPVNGREGWVYGPVAHSPMYRSAEAVRAKYPEDFAYIVGPQINVQQRHFAFRRSPKGHICPVDSCFPEVLRGTSSLASSDETACDFLYGLVRATQPRIALETGTNRGRSAQAIVRALRANAEIDMMVESYRQSINDPGHLWTVDEFPVIEPEKVFTGPERAYVTLVKGRTPEIFEQEPLASLQGIEFAYLDGDHSAAGLDADLTYVDLHRAAECWVAIDNTRDPGFPGISRYLAEYRKYPRLSLPTACGTDVIHMFDAVARSPRAESAVG
jgi:hypothetical protein